MSEQLGREKFLFILCCQGLWCLVRPKIQKFKIGTCRKVHEGSSQDVPLDLTAIKPQTQPVQEVHRPGLEISKLADTIREEFPSIREEDLKEFVEEATLCDSSGRYRRNFTVMSGKDSTIAQLDIACAECVKLDAKTVNFAFKRSAVTASVRPIRKWIDHFKKSKQFLIAKWGTEHWSEESTEIRDLTLNEIDAIGQILAKASPLLKDK